MLVFVVMQKIFGKLKVQVGLGVGACGIGEAI